VKSSIDKEFSDTENGDVGSSDNKASKYSSGDTFLTTTNKWKTVVQSYNKENKTYHVKYYENNGSNWNLHLDDKEVNQDIFEKDVANFIAAGTLYEDIKI